MGFTNQLTNQLNLRGHLLWLWEEKAKSPSAGLDKSLLSEETLRITPEGIQWVAWLCNKGRDGYGSSCLWFPMIHTIWMARWSRNLMKSQLFRDGKITASSPETSRIFAKVVVMCTAPVAASWGTKMSECDRGAFQTISIQGPVHSCWISASNGIWVGVQLWRRGAVTPQAPIPPGHDKVQLRVWRFKLDPWHRGFVSEKWEWGCPERKMVVVMMISTHAPVCCWRSQAAGGLSPKNIDPMYRCWFKRVDCVSQHEQWAVSMWMPPRARAVNLSRKRRLLPGGAAHFCWFLTPTSSVYLP